MADKFVPVEKVSGLCVQVRIPVTGASAAVFCAVGCVSQTSETGEKAEMGAVCAAAAQEVRSKVLRASSAPARTIRAGAFAASISGGHLCLSIVTDKSLTRVKAFIKQALTVSSKLSSSSATKAARSVGIRPGSIDKCLKHLSSGCKKASVVVSGPLKETKRSAVMAAIQAGKASASLKGGPSVQLGGSSPSIAQAGQHSMSGAGAALPLARDHLRDKAHCSSVIIGDHLVVSEKDMTAVRKVGDKAKEVLKKSLNKAGDTGRAYWRAASEAVHVGDVQDVNALSTAVAALLKK